MIGDVSSRRYPEVLLEERREVALAAESDFLANFTNGVFSCEKKLCGAVEAVNAQQIGWRYAGKGFHLAVEVCA